MSMGYGSPLLRGSHAGYFRQSYDLEAFFSFREKVENHHIL